MRGEVETGIAEGVVVLGLAAGVTGDEVGAEIGAERLGDGEVPSFVEGLDGGDGIFGQVVIDHVADLFLGENPAVTLRGDLVHDVLEPHAHELDQHGVVDLVRMHVVEGGHQIRQ